MTTKVSELAECAGRLADLTAKREGAAQHAKDLRGQIEHLRGERARAMADGQAPPDRAPLLALEGELAGVEAVIAEVGRRLEVAEQDHRRLERESWRERVVALRLEAAEVQAELTRTTVAREALQRQESTLGSTITSLLAEAGHLEARANAR